MVKDRHRILQQLGACVLAMLLLLVLPAPSSLAQGQTDMAENDLTQTRIFPELSGQALRERLLDQFQQESSVDDLNYREARTILYGRIDNENGIVRGIYSGLEVEVPFGAPDARTIAYQGGNGINAEHAWPQSRGARQEPARSDMHHLFPTWASANSSRGNLPFADINDQTTDTWIGNNRTRLPNPPSSNIDDFSEVLNEVAFEPPEAYKGNIARAMFYFNTMYPDRDERFFDGQQETLCRWHEQDPADAAEIERSHAIRAFQGNNNPFVLDPTLAGRIYCN